MLSKCSHGNVSIQNVRESQKCFQLKGQSSQGKTLLCSHLTSIFSTKSSKLCKDATESIVEITKKDALFKLVALLMQVLVVSWEVTHNLMIQNLTRLGFHRLCFNMQSLIAIQSIQN